VLNPEPPARRRDLKAAYKQTNANLIDRDQHYSVTAKSFKINLDEIERALMHFDEIKDQSNVKDALIMSHYTGDPIYLSL